MNPDQNQHQNQNFTTDIKSSNEHTLTSLGFRMFKNMLQTVLFRTWIKQASCVKKRTIEDRLGS